MVPYGNYSLNSYFDASDFLFYHEYDLMQLIFTFLMISLCPKNSLPSILFPRYEWPPILNT